MFIDWIIILKTGKQPKNNEDVRTNFFPQNIFTFEVEINGVNVHDKQEIMGKINIFFVKGVINESIGTINLIWISHI